MKMKRLVSALVALTIAASSFVALTITASAATELINENFDGDVPAAWTDGASDLSVTVTDGYLKAVNTKTSARDKTVTLPANTGNAKAGKLSFDFNGAQWNYASEADLGFDVMDSDGNVIFTLMMPYVRWNAADTKLNGVALAGVSQAYRAADNWYTADMVLDFVAHTFDYSIYKQGDKSSAIASAESVPMVNSNASGVGKIKFYGNRTTSDYVAIDNFVLTAFSIPTLELKDAAEGGGDVETIMINTNGSATVYGVITLGTEGDEVVTSAESSSGTVTVGVVNETTLVPQIQVTAGSVTESAQVTVTTKTTGVKSDAKEVTSKTFNVLVGEVKYGDVTVEYKDSLGNVLKPSTKVEGIPVGTSYTATEELADIEDCVVDGIHYSATFAGGDSSVAVESEDGATLTLIFDKTEKKSKTIITTAYYAEVTVSGKSKTGTSVNEVVYSAYPSGEAELDLPDGTYNISVTKSGYTFATDQTVTVTYGGSNNAATVAVTDQEYMFYEDYKYTGLTGDSRSLFGNQRLQNNNGVLQIFGNTTVPVSGASDAIDYTVKIASMNYWTASPGTRDREKSISFKDGDTTVFAITVTMKSGEVTAKTLTTGATDNNSIELTDFGAVDLTISNGTLTGTVGTQSINLSAPNITKIDGISFAGGAEAYLSVSVGPIAITGTPAPEVTFKTRAQAKGNTEKVQFNFVASPKYDGDVTVTEYGFWMVNLLSEDLSAALKAVGKDTLGSDDSFYYTTDEFEYEDATVAFWAIPWVKFGEVVVGSAEDAFTYTGALNTNDIVESHGGTEAQN